jgi:cytochrome d ubiquinol oxidase subunit I
VVVLLVALWGLWLMWRKRLERSTWFLRAAVWAVVLPFVMNTAGWLLTESGRQPWIVQGIQLTKDGVSPSVSTTEVVTSIIVFFILYTVLTGIWAVLMVRFGKREVAPERPAGEEDQPIPAMTY